MNEEEEYSLKIIHENGILRMFENGIEIDAKMWLWGILTQGCISIKIKKRIDCMTCKHFDRYSDSCPFCQYEYDENTDCEANPYAGRIER